MSGKRIRLKRFWAGRDERMVIFPLDHGVSCGPVPGLQNVETVIRLGIREGVDALVMHKGMLRLLEGIARRLPGIFMHLSASTTLGCDVHRKMLVGTVEEAIQRGADGVSMHINLGDIHEPDMLRDLGSVGTECARWGIPLLVMIYVRGANAPSPVPDAAIAHAARVAAEMGADIIKIPAPQDDMVLAGITSDLPVPVVVAGGSKAPDEALFLKHIESALSAGARGVAVGRNVFQSDHPTELLQAICGIVRRGRPAAEMLEKLLSARA